jgi:hypothetical protein
MFERATYLVGAAQLIARVLGDGEHWISRGNDGFYDQRKVSRLIADSVDDRWQMVAVIFSHN